MGHKKQERPVIAKCTLRAKKVLYAVFFSGEGVAIQVPVKKGKSVTGKYYKDVIVKTLKKYHQKWHPILGFKHVWLLHDNAQAIGKQFALVQMFCKKR